ncbi:MAG: SRPBCC family protein [Vicinamibacterales bacterium]
MSIRVRSDLEIEMRRTFAFPRRLVFEAHSKPEYISRWWGPRGSELISCDMDFRPGGAWRFVVGKPGGQQYAFRGEYKEVVPPERLVYTFEFEGMPGSITVDAITFTEHEGHTTLTCVSRMDSIEARDAMLASGMEKGAAETYDRLEEMLGGISGNSE